MPSSCCRLYLVIYRNGCSDWAKFCIPVYRCVSRTAIRWGLHIDATWQIRLNDRWELSMSISYSNLFRFTIAMCCAHSHSYRVEAIQGFYSWGLCGVRSGEGWLLKPLRNMEVCGQTSHGKLLKYKKHSKNVGPIRYCERFYIVIHQGSLLPPLSHAACASMSTTTTTRDRGDRYGSMEWAVGPMKFSLCYVDFDAF